MSEVGHIKSSHTCHWRVPNWSQLRLGKEYSSPPLLFDDLKWSIKLYKGKVKTPDMVSIYVEIHETSPGSLRGIRKNVQLTFKINNTNPSSYYNDFGVGKRLQPVWFSEKHTKWGEDSLGTSSSIIPFLSRDQLSLSVNITILKSEVNNMSILASADTISSSLFSKYIDSPQFSDVLFKVIEEEEEENFSLEESKSMKTDEQKNIRIFHGHKSFLAAISPWFNIIFTNGMKESIQNEITISGVKHDIFYRLLKYCYSFKIDIDGLYDAYEMLKASDRFQISNIREECLRYLRQELNEENIWDIWECADMYGCEKTINTCTSYASVEMKTLIKHSSWLYANPRVIKMALDIEVGDLPEERELYEAVLLWAKQREDKITIIDNKGQKEDVKNPSMTRTQLLASVVDVEPLAISSAVAEPDEDDEDEEVQKHSLEEEEQEKRTVTHTERVIIPVDPHDLKLDLANILQCIRFPMMPPDFLADRVEADSYIMSIDGMKDMLYEAYKYHAVVGTSSSVRCQPRRPYAENDEL